MTKKKSCLLAAYERCTLNRGSFACKIVQGDIVYSWPHTEGARLIEVAATAGGTVYHGHSDNHILQTE